MGLRSKVGSFVKNTATGSQVVSGVAFKGKALILWTTGAEADNTVQHVNRLGVGYSGSDASNVITSACIAMGATATTSPNNQSKSMAATALRIITGGNTLLDECTLTSFDDDGFTLNWGTASANPTIIHYMVIGGTSLTGVRVLTFNSRATAGSQSITGAGFQPELVLFAMAGQIGSGALPLLNSSASFTIGAAASSSARWTIALRDQNAQTTTNTLRWMREDRCMISSLTGGTQDVRCSFTSMDADGFTINYADVPAAHKTIAMCFDGGSYVVGSTAKVTAGTSPQSQSVTDPGFKPAGVLFATAFETHATSATNSTSEARMMIGAADADGNEISGAMNSQHAVAASGANVFDCIARDGKSVFVADNTTEAEQNSADTTMTASGFDWLWTGSITATATQVDWIAFGPWEAAPSGALNNQVVAAA